MIGNGNGGAKARGILIYIESVVEVRDACPLVLYFVIHNQLRSKVVHNELLVQIVQGGGIQGFAALGHGVGIALKLGKHRLAVDGSLEIFEVLVQQGQAGCGILVLFCQQVLNEQVLVDGGSDLCDKQGIVGILGGLSVAAEPAVHAVAHLVRNGGNAVQRAGKVAHDIGVGIIAAAGVSAAALALVGEHIDPALGKALANDGAVLFAQRCNGIQNHLLGLVIGVMGADALGQRGIHIIVVQLVHTQDALAQSNIAVHIRQVLAHSSHQVIIDLAGHVLPCHGHGAGRFIMTDGGFGSSGLDSAGVRGSQRVDVLAEALVVAFKGILAQHAVIGGLQQDVVGSGQLHIVALAILDGIEHHIGVSQVIGNVFRGAECLTESSQQLFFRGGQGVRLCTQQVLQGKAVGGNLLVSHDGIQGFLRQCQDFRLSIGDGTDSLYIFGGSAGIHALGVISTGILAQTQAGVDSQVFQFTEHADFCIIKFTNAGSVVQLALPGSQSFNFGVNGGKCLFPFRIAGVHFGQVPLVLRVHLFAFFQCFRHGGFSFSVWCLSEPVREARSPALHAGTIHPAQTNPV